MRIFYDSVNPESVPNDGTGYMGYTDGNYPDAAALKAAHPGRPVVTLTVNMSTFDADGCDVEHLNLTLSQLPVWVVKKRATNTGPAYAYCSESTWPTCQQECAAANVAEPLWIIANYDNDPTIPAGAVGKQYATNDTYDTSAMVTYLPGVDPTPLVDQGDDMIACLPTGKGYACLKPTGAVDCFGKLPYSGSPNTSNTAVAGKPAKWNGPGVIPTGDTCVGICVSAPAGPKPGQIETGYRVLTAKGRVFCYGSAADLGEPSNPPKGA